MHYNLLPPRFCSLSEFTVGHSLHTMAGKCVHKGCGKTFSDPEEDCVYHPGPPVFHEGQKGRYLGRSSYTSSVSVILQ